MKDKQNDEYASNVQEIFLELMEYIESISPIGRNLNPLFKTLIISNLILGQRN